MLILYSVVGILDIIFRDPWEILYVCSIFSSSIDHLNGCQLRHGWNSGDGNIPHIVYESGREERGSFHFQQRK